MATSTTAPSDSPEARKYNRIRRWLGVGEFALGLVLLLVLLVTGWTGWIRDIAYRSQSYALAVFLYTLMLIVISKLLGMRRRGFWSARFLPGCWLNCCISSFDNTQNTGGCWPG